MRKATKVFAIILALVLVVAVFAGCDKTTPNTTGTPTKANTSTPTTPAKPPLVLEGIHYSIPNPINAPKDNSLTDYILNKANEYVGREVQMTWYGRTLAGQTWSMYLQTQIAANTYPDMLMTSDLFWLPDDLKFIRDSENTREFTADLIKANMPGFVARLEKYGYNFDTYFEAQKDTTTGKSWYVATTPPMDLMTDLPTYFTPMKGVDPYYAWKGGNGFYGIMLRDDVLKAINPATKSEKELLEVYKQKSGILEVSDVVGDMPFTGTLASLTEFMQKVKDLGMKASNGQPIQPGCPNSSSERVDSLNWSMATTTGYCWRYPVRYGDDPGQSVFINLTPEYKSVMLWYNDLYNKGLIDPEMFVMKDDQMKAKITNGEYAMFNGWLYNDAIRAQATKDGYGYRYFPLGYNIVDFSRNNNHYNIVTDKASSTLVFSKNIKDEDLADAMKYFDYFLTEESDNLAYWGLPEWTEGEGMDRKYQAEYQELQDWTLYGTQSEKDGRYYGIVASPPAAWDGWNVGFLPIKSISFFAQNIAYPDAPYYVIPQDINKLLANINLQSVCTNTVLNKYAKPLQEYYVEKADFRYSDLNLLPEAIAFDKNSPAGNGSPNTFAAHIKAVTGKPDKFEANYKIYADMYVADGVNVAQDAINKVIKEKWQSGVIANLLPKHTAK